MALAKNIRFLRKQREWSQDDLADKLGYKSYTTIQKWESGVSEPPLKIVHALARIFDVDINDLTNIDLETNSVQAQKHSKPDVLDEVDIAFYGEYKQLTDDDKDTIRDMVRVMRERRAKKQE